MSYKPLIFIDGKDFTKLTEYRVAYNKLYGSDAHRDMAGTDRSTLIGIFPKIHCTTGKLREDDIRFLVNVAMKPEFTVEWYDVFTGKMSKGQFYMNDPDFNMKRYSDKYYLPVKFNLIPKRRYR